MHKGEERSAREGWYSGGRTKKKKTTQKKGVLSSTGVDSWPVNMHEGKIGEAVWGVNLDFSPILNMLFSFLKN